MSAVLVVMAVTGILWWACLLLLGTVLTLHIAAARRSRPQVGDDAIAMVRQSWADDKVRADLERELAEMDKQIRGDLGA